MEVLWLGINGKKKIGPAPLQLREAMETRYIGDVIYIHMKQDIITEKRVSLWLLCGVQHSVLTLIMPETQQPIIVIILIIVSYILVPVSPLAAKLQAASLSLQTSSERSISRHAQSHRVRTGLITRGRWAGSRDIRRHFQGVFARFEVTYDHFPAYTTSLGGLERIIKGLRAQTRQTIGSCR